MKIKKIICIIISLCVLIGAFSVTAYADAAQKNRVSISQKSITLTKGKTYKLKLKKANAKKVRWSTKNKKTAIVKNGKVTAKGVGKTTIIAKYNKKTYTCKVTVKAKKKPTTTKMVTTTNHTEKEETTVENTTQVTNKETSVSQPTSEPISENTSDNTTENTTEPNTQPTEPETSESQNKVLKLKVDSQEIDVIWEDNTSVDALKEMAENGNIVIQLSKYGGFEQFGDIGSTLPSNDKRITTQPGDIVLYSSDSIVMFYGSNTWSYTKLGKVQGLTNEELAALLGNDNVTVTIYLE